MKALVTGGAGFLGSNLTAYLLEKGYKVTVVDCLNTGSEDNIARFKTNPNFSFYKMGIETDEFVKEFSDTSKHAFDFVYDLACPTGVPNIEFLGEEMIDACSTGTKNVLTVARKHKAKFLLTSSSEVYGDPEVFPQREDYTGNVDALGWRASYEEGKRFSETLVSLFVKKYGLQAKMVRLFNVYGPYMNLVDQRVIPRFVTQALRNEPITLHGNNAYRTMCFVTDIVRGLEVVIENGVAGEAYNLGSDQELTMKELAQKIIELIKSDSEITIIPALEHDHKRRMPDLTKIRSLGWDYSISLEKGLAMTIENFKKRLTIKGLLPEVSLSNHV